MLFPDFTSIIARQINAVTGIAQFPPNVPQRAMTLNERPDVRFNLAKELQVSFHSLILHKLLRAKLTL